MRFKRKFLNLDTLLIKNIRSKYHFENNVTVEIYQLQILLDGSIHIWDGSSGQATYSSNELSSANPAGFVAWSDKKERRRKATIYSHVTCTFATAFDVHLWFSGIPCRPLGFPCRFALDFAWNPHLQIPLHSLALRWQMTILHSSTPDFAVGHG